MRSIDPWRRQAIRAALDIRDHLVGTGRWNGQVKLPSAPWEEVKRGVGRLEFAVTRGWHAARESLLMDLDYQIRQLRSELDGCCTELRRASDTGRIATAGEIVADLFALQSEFDGLAIDVPERRIQVHTDPIVLEETALGSFQIALSWDRIGHDRAYQVIAESPCSPHHDSEVTHPHVRDRVLCEGDGAAAIRKALAEGRLLDFFTLVRQVLETYNPGSAFVPLDRWDGVACHDCGYHMPGDDYGTCNCCDEPLCSDCSACCQRCERYVCNSCNATCEACQANLCEGCLEVVAGSGRLLCPDCFEQALEEASNDSCSAEDHPPGPSESPAAACAAFAAHAVCLVEAPLPA